MPPGLRRDFCVTHFFNPPRYMRLLEVVSGPDTRADAIDQVVEFADVTLGKAVVMLPIEVTGTRVRVTPQRRVD